MPSASATTPSPSSPNPPSTAPSVPFVKYNGHTLATLPYGKSLTRGSLICRSESSGMTCADLSTRHGFRVARSGIVLF